GTMAPPLEDAEAGGVFDERAQLVRPAREDLLHAALADDRAAEAQFGQHLEDVRPPHRRAVHEVLALPAAVQPARDRELGVAELGDVVGALEDELDLAEGGGRPFPGAAEEDVVRLLGAKLSRAEAPRCPDDRVGDVRLPGSVRPDEDRRPGLEAELDRIGEALEAAQADACEVHARSLPVGPDAGAGYRFRPDAAEPALPGEDLIRRGLADLSAGVESAEALLVSIGAPRLAGLGLVVPSRFRRRSTGSTHSSRRRTPTRRTRATTRSSGGWSATSAQRNACSVPA